MCKISCFQIHIINLYVLCYRLVQRRKESHEVCYPTNLAATDGPLKQLLLLHGGSYQTSHWQECASNRLFRHSFFHCPMQYHTAPSCLFPLPRREISHLQETAASQTARKILEIQITFSQMR